jgi:hypothetical protein
VRPVTVTGVPAERTPNSSAVNEGRVYTVMSVATFASQGPLPPGSAVGVGGAGVGVCAVSEAEAVERERVGVAPPLIEQASAVRAIKVKRARIGRFIA